VGIIEKYMVWHRGIRFIRAGTSGKRIADTDGIIAEMDGLAVSISH